MKKFGRGWGGVAGRSVCVVRRNLARVAHTRKKKAQVAYVFMRLHTETGGICAHRNLDHKGLGDEGLGTRVVGCVMDLVVQRTQDEGRSVGR